MSLTVGLVWQFVLVAVLVGREQRSVRWSTIREALWLRLDESATGSVNPSSLVAEEPKGDRHTDHRAWVEIRALDCAAKAFT